MCGIAGAIAFDGSQPDPAATERMTRALSHRGPDGAGFRHMPSVEFGHRRLAIIDIEHGHQPMANERGDVWVIFNGEIYNAAPLRDTLRARGHAFATGCDTEVLVHMYEEHGPSMVTELRGMFAFCIWDERNRRGLLARDRFGIKPLYYSHDGNRLVFASELKAILAAADVPRELDKVALDAYLALHYIPAPLCIFKHVRKLPHGHLMEVRDGRIDTRAYGSPMPGGTPEEARGSRDEGASLREVRAALEESVEEHMISDVPVGVFLSGGVDSSVIAALAARKSREPIRTFTIRFEDPRYDEGPAARAVADHIGSVHVEETIRPDAVRSLPDLVRIYDEPFGDPAALPGLHLAALAARSVKVCLSGDGGDETFGGYARYQRLMRLSRLRRVHPALLRTVAGVGAAVIPEHVRGHHLARRIAAPGPVQYLREFGGFDAATRRDIVDPAYQPDAIRDDAFFGGLALTGASRGELLRRIQQMDIQSYLPECILTKVDRISMAHSLEVRPPLLDHRLARMAIDLPAAMKVRDGLGKWALREAGRDLLPPGTLEGRKRGFTVPITEWFRDDLHAFARATLLSERSARRGILRPAAVRAVLDRHARGGRSFADQIWSLLFLEFWFRAFVDG